MSDVEHGTKHHAQVISSYLFIIGAEKFLGTHKRPLFRYGSRKQTQVSAFVTIFLRPNIQPRLSTFDFIFVHCFVGELLYFISRHFRGFCRHFLKVKT